MTSVYTTSVRVLLLLQYCTSPPLITICSTKHGMANCKRYEGKVVLVTAATAGIGLGIAERLGQEGAKLVICSRKQNNVEDTLKLLKSKSIECVGCVCHVGNREHLKKFVQLAIDSYGKIDALVSNAAVNPASGPLLDIPESAIDKTLEINIKAAIMLVKEVAPHLKRGASIVFISSYTAFNPSAPLAIYAVSKTAVVGLTKAFANELGPRGIRVNCVAPGKLVFVNVRICTDYANCSVYSCELHVARLS